MTALAPSLQAYFTQRLIGERAASPNTIASCKVTFQLLLAFANASAGSLDATHSKLDVDGPNDTEHPDLRTVDSIQSHEPAAPIGGSRAPVTSCSWPGKVGMRTLVPLNHWTTASWPATMNCMSSTWRKVTYLPVGGLAEVGFADGPLLLVVSHQGRGVVDLASGELLARDRQESGAWFDAGGRAALGSARWKGRGSASAALSAAGCPTPRPTAGRPAYPGTA
jgi:hypothetical protein